MKRMFQCITVAVVIGAVASARAEERVNQEILRQLQELRELVTKQQTEIDYLRSKLEDSAQEETDRLDAAVVREQVDALLQERGAATPADKIDEHALGQVKDLGGYVELSKHIEKLKFKGDLRLRYERQERSQHRDVPDFDDDGRDLVKGDNIEIDPGTGEGMIAPKKNDDGDVVGYKTENKSSDDEETRDRFRARVRLGAEWLTADEGWKVAAGLATGGAEATSTNDTFSDKDVFETGDIRLDYAYAQHMLFDEEGTAITLTLGQRKNPWTSSFMLWDSDVRPVGITASGEMDLVFATIGAYDVSHVEREEADALLYAGQLGTKLPLGENAKLTLAAAYYYFNEATTSNLNEKSGLPAPGISPLVDDDYQFEIGDIYGELSLKLDDVMLKLYGQYWRNLGAENVQYVNNLGVTVDAGTHNGDIIQDFDDPIDPEDNDVGWVLGLEGTAHGFKIGYAYGHVEADSVYRETKDSDFGDTAGLADTDVEGHKLYGSYRLTEHLSLGLTYMTLSEI